MLWTWLTLWLSLTVAHADPGNEVVILLDNSCSMVDGTQVMGTDERLPPNDPERAAWLAVQIVEGLVRGSEDALTVVAFGDEADDPARVVRSGPAIRDLPYGGQTWFRPSLAAAADAMDASKRSRRIFVLFTDGSPSDLVDVSAFQTAVQAVKADATAVIGLYASDVQAAMAQPYLDAAAPTPSDLTVIDATQPDVMQQLVRSFTAGYARALGSKPESGTLRPGGEVRLDVGRYVTEVLVSTASVQPGSAFTAELSGPNGRVDPRARGDNGCPFRYANPNLVDLCTPPRRHFTTFRAANDPFKASTWTLRLPNAPGEVEYGVILRYDLTPTLSMPAKARVSDEVPVEASLLFRGQTFVDEAFFAADNFRVTLTVGDAEVPLSHQGQGRFGATFVPQVSGNFEARVRFENDWFHVDAPSPIAIEGFLPLQLQPTPNPVDLGVWRGERGRSERCETLDLTGNLNADRVPHRCEVEGQAADAVLTCAADPDSRATLPNGQPGQPLRYTVCVTASGCCGALPDADAVPFQVRLRGDHDHYAADAVHIPVRFQVEPTGLLRCWWVELSTVAGVLFFLWAAWGFLSPASFDPSLSARVAGSAVALRRASSVVLAEQPGGRRGFYRPARFCLMADGTATRKPGPAMLVVEARGRGTMRFRKAPGLERQDRRTQKFQPVPEDDLALGPDAGTVYRIGSLYLRFT